MSVRTKLNEMYLFAALIWSGFIGLAFNSWTAFAIAMGAMTALNLVGGNIRLVAARR